MSFFALLNPLCGRILDKRGPYLLSLAGLVLLGGATFGLSFIGIDTPLSTVVILYAFRTLGVVALLQPLQTWAVNSVESKFISHGTALMNTVRQVGGSIISALLVTVMSVSARDNGDMKGIETSFLVTSILVFLSLAVSAVLIRPKKSAEESREKESARRFAGRFFPYYHHNCPGIRERRPGDRPEGCPGIENPFL